MITSITIQTELLRLQGVKSISLSDNIPTETDGYLNIYPENSSQFISMLLLPADNDYASVYGIQLQEGRFLNYGNINYIPGQVVLNEAAEKLLGWKTAVGKTIHLGASNGPLYAVAGVVKDFHSESLQHAVQPLVIANLNEPFTRSYRFFSIKLNTSNINNSIIAIQKKWRLLFPDMGFEYAFMADKFQSLYKSELQLKKAAGIRTVLNLIIVFMGVFGVVAFTLNKRTKEIAIRKVFGAHVRNIILLFIKDYTLLIVVANVIAWPIAYSITNKWLENYAYRIRQDIIPYVFVCLFIFITAFLLIAAQCFKTASSNPVKSLRSE